MTTTNLSALLLNDEPISLIDAKLHLRLAVTANEAMEYTTEDGYIGSLVISARESAERYTGRTIKQRTRNLYLGGFPSADTIEIPYPPLVSLTGVYYTKRDEVSETEYTDVTVDTQSEPGKVVKDYGKSWPADNLERVNPVRIEYISGYATVPEPIVSAMKLRITDLYEQRGSVIVGTSAVQIPDYYDRLLATYRMWSHL